MTAFYNGTMKTATISVTPTTSTTVALSAVTVNPTSVAGGTNATGTVTLTAAAPAGGLSVDLWTTGAAAYVPSSVTIAAGSTTGTFSITTIEAGSDLQDTVTAFYNGAIKTASITVKKAF